MILLSTLVCAAPSEPADTPATAEESDDTRPPGPSKRLGLRFDVGFPHWFSDDFQSAPQARSGSIGLGYRPLDWRIEVYARWEWATIAVHESHPDFAMLDEHWIDFSYFGLAYVHPVHMGHQHVRVGVTALAVMPRLGGEPPTIGLSGGFSTHLTFDIGRGLELGPFVDVRENTFHIRRPDATFTRWQVDASIAIGVALIL